MGANAQLYGHLVRDPELKFLPSGTAKVELRVAVNRVGDKRDDGSYGPGFFDVVVFGNQAENVAQYLGKGSALYAAGRLHFHEWEAQDGTGKRSKVEIIASDVTFGAKAEARDDGGAPAQDDQQEPDDDIPF